MHARENSMDFRLNVKDPFSPINREINEEMIVPQKRFDTIMEEYISVRQKFDDAKKGLGTTVGTVGDKDGSKAEIETLKNKIELM